MENIWIAFLLAAGAGLSTTIGSVLGIITHKPGPRFMAFTLGFSAGVMILVSFVEMMPAAFNEIGAGASYVAFLAGMALYFLIDFFVPHDYIGQHDHVHDANHEIDGPMTSLRRTSILVALGVSIHNFPEGMAAFVGGLQEVNVGLAIAVAIAIHNIPEGLAISAPVYAATGSRTKAFLWSFFSGVSEVAGAAVAAGLLLPVITVYPHLTATAMGYTHAVVAGIMVVISIDELIPVAKSFDTEHTPVIGVMVGVAVMALSLVLLG
jgi:ZIP family zinc transporter